MNERTCDYDVVDLCSNDVNITSILHSCVFLFDSNLWLFVSKFTDLTPNRLHKVYKHMVRKRSEKQQQSHEVPLSSDILSGILL